MADEPVSALDVSIRSQVLNLMKRLQAEHDLTYIVISHDLAVVKYLADRIGVMYLGRLVETGSGDDIYNRPAHPYTAGLLAADPDPGPPDRAGARRGPASAASSRARSARRRAAGSGPGVPAPGSSAPTRPQSSARSVRDTRPRATSR